MRKVLFYFLTISLLCCIGLGGTSCESEDCFLTTTAYCYFGFSDSDGHVVKLNDSITVYTDSREYDTLYAYYSTNDTIVSQEPVDSLSDKGYELVIERVPVKLILVNRIYAAEGIQLPLSYAEEEDTFFLMYSQRLIDTLWVRHNNIPYFTSMECGTVMHYKILEVGSTNHLIDSIKILKPDINNALKENIRIYYTVSN